MAVFLDDCQILFWWYSFESFKITRAAHFLLCQEEGTLYFEGDACYEWELYLLSGAQALKYCDFAAPPDEAVNEGAKS